MDFGEVIEKLNNASQIDDIDKLCLRICEDLDVDYYLLVIFFPESLLKSKLLLLDNYPTEWMRYYQENDLKRSDPIVLHSMQHTTPIIWHDIKKDGRFTHWRHATVMNMAEDVKLKDGISIPLHGLHGETGVFSFSVDRRFEQIEIFKIMSYAQTILPFIYTALNKINIENTNSIINLTNREKECLLWACEGKTAWEISQILKISERTVNFHLTSTINKLGSNNRHQAIAKAIMLGIIKPSL